MYFSIVMPVFNAENYINNAVESIISQSFTDFELILVDDGSSDNSGHIIDQLSVNSKNIISIHKPNGGPSSARNLGIKSAHGKYLLFVDSDDRLKPDALNILYKNLIISNADCLCFGYNTIRLSENCNNDLVPENKSYHSQEDISKHYLEIINSFFFSVVWNKAYKLKVICDNRIIMDETLYIGEDYCFNLNILDTVNSFITLNQSLYNYLIQNPDSITCKYDSNKNSQLLKVAKIKGKYLLKNNYLSNEIKNAEINFDHIKLYYTFTIDSFKKESGLKLPQIYNNLKNFQQEFSCIYNAEFMKHYSISKKVLYYLYTKQHVKIMFLLSAIIYFYKYKSKLFKEKG